MEVQRDALPGNVPGLPRLTERDFRRLSRFIEDELGIRMPDAKRVMLESRLQKRVRKLGFTRFSDYVDFLFSEGEGVSEIINMIDAVTTNKTDFFRESDHFSYLLRSVLPDAWARDLACPGSARPLSFWSAGCSTGEEPYTLAMVLEEFRRANPGFEYRIFASDLSSRVLDRARMAIYEQERVEPVPEGYRKKYLLRSRDPSRGEVRVKPELRQRITFARINFMDPCYPVEGLFDVAFCRNVMIYFERKLQETIIGRICSHIRSGGWLFLGHSETIAGMDLPLRSVAPTIYARL